MARAKKPVTKPTSSSLADAVNTAFSDIDCLRDELQGWYDNLPENFQNGDKGEALTTAIELMEQSSEPTVPECIADTEISWGVYTYANSRRKRCEDATSAVEAALEACNEYLSTLDELEYYENGSLVQNNPAMPQTEDERDTLVTEVECLRDELDNAKAEWEQVEFPGMF